MDIESMMFKMNDLIELIMDCIVPPDEEISKKESSNVKIQPKRVKWYLGDEELSIKKN